MGPDAMILIFWMLSFKPTFSLSSFTFFKRLFAFLVFVELDILRNQFYEHNLLKSRKALKSFMITTAPHD